MADYDGSRDGTKANVASSTGLSPILEHARENARLAQLVFGPAYRTAEDDQAFLAGRQWDPVDEALRRRAGRVTLTINDLGQYLDQIVGDLRMNPTQVRVRAADFTSSQAEFVSMSGRKYSSADVRAGLIREIEYRSLAPLHYALAGQHAAETGLGFLRVYHDYMDDMSMSQDICIERIKNRWSVWCDPMATQPDWSDMNFAFVGSWMKRSEFTRKYPTYSLASILPDDQGFWHRENFVRTTEYYWRDDYSYDLLQLDNGTLVRSIDEKQYEVAKVSGRVVNQRKVTGKKVHQALITYSDILGEPIVEPGQVIPVVPVIGKRIEGSQDDLLYGVVRFAKDPKRMENYWLSMATERVSLSPSAPWLVTANMIKGYEGEWAQANAGLKAYLTYNVDEDNPEAGGPKREQAPVMPVAEIQMLSQMSEYVKATVGFHDAGVGRARNDQSGIAIEKLQHESDVGAYVFSANTQVAVARVGMIVNTWLPSVYDSQRFITVRHENNEIDVIEINRVAEDGTLINDLSAGRFDVHIDAGPSYSTLRQQSAETMLELIKTDPGGSVAYKDIMFENMDFPGSDRVAARVRKLVPPQLLSPDEMTQEERNAPPPQPTPEQQAEMAKNQATMATASATVETADANKVKAKATIAQAETDMVALIAGSPEQADANFRANKGAKAADDAAKAAAKPAAAPKSSSAMSGLEDLIKELVLNTLAEQMATQQGASDAGSRTAAGPGPSG